MVKASDIGGVEVVFPQPLLSASRAAEVSLKHDAASQIFVGYDAVKVDDDYGFGSEGSTNVIRLAEDHDRDQLTLSAWKDWASEWQGDHPPTADEGEDLSDLDFEEADDPDYATLDDVRLAHLIDVHLADDGTPTAHTLRHDGVTVDLDRFTDADGRYLNSCGAPGKRLALGS